MQYYQQNLTLLNIKDVPQSRQSVLEIVTGLLKIIDGMLLMRH